jgi:hypothetical protein
MKVFAGMMIIIGLWVMANMVQAYETTVEEMAYSYAEDFGNEEKFDMCKCKKIIGAITGDDERKSSKVCWRAVTILLAERSAISGQIETIMVGCAE